MPHSRPFSSPPTQDVRHIELRLPRNVAGYEAGDVAVVHPENGGEGAADAIAGFAACLEGSPCLDDVFTLTPASAEGAACGWLPSPCSVRKLLTRYLDVLGMPRRSFFEQASNATSCHVSCRATSYHATDPLTHATDPRHTTPLTHATDPRH